MSKAPDIGDDDLVLWDFVIADLEHALDRITTTIRAIRSKPHWQSFELVGLKVQRAKLHLLLQQARSSGLDAEQHQVIQAILTTSAGLTL